MPRNMSFMLTTAQVKAGTKTVTRRMGWLNLKANTLIWAVEKCQGLKKGEKINRLRQIRVVDVRREPLSAITKDDCVKEGFPEMEPAEFLQFFSKHNKCAIDEEVTRIEFEYVEVNLCQQGG
jgi:hypothetical protein